MAMLRLVGSGLLFAALGAAGRRARPLPARVQTHLSHLMGIKDHDHTWPSDGIYRQGYRALAYPAQLARVFATGRASASLAPADAYEAVRADALKVSRVGGNMISEILTTFRPKRLPVFNGNTAAALALKLGSIKPLAKEAFRGWHYQLVTETVARFATGSERGTFQRRTPFSIISISTSSPWVETGSSPVAPNAHSERAGMCAASAQRAQRLQGLCGEIWSSRPFRKGRPDRSDRARVALDGRPPTAHCGVMQDKSATAEAADAGVLRYKSRPANAGWLVLDTLTGEPVVIGGIAQVGLSKIDADHTAATLQGLQSVLDA